MAHVGAFGEVMMKLEVPDHLLLEQTDHVHISFSGTGINILSGLSKFGHSPSMITTLPSNSIGDAAVSYIRKLGIDTAAINRDGEYIGQYILESGFSVRPSKVTYSNRRESSFNQSSLTDYDLAAIFEKMEMIHFCGIMLAISDETRRLALQMAEAAKKYGMTVVFDCNYRPKLWAEAKVDPQTFYKKMLEFADICFMSERDVLHILKMETDEVTKEGQLEELLPGVAAIYNIPWIAGVIRNEDQLNQGLKGFLYDGSFAYSRDYVYNTLERIGAGDGFGSGLMHGWLNGFSREDAIQFAAAAGVLAHTTYGDSPRCSEADVWNLVGGNHVSIER